MTKDEEMSGVRFWIFNTMPLKNRSVCNERTALFRDFQNSQLGKQFISGQQHQRIEAIISAAQA